jgi:hypothetical protein
LGSNQANVTDIEDIVQLGKERHVCPYYATRSGVKQAEVGIRGGTPNGTERFV